MVWCWLLMTETGHQCLRVHLHADRELTPSSHPKRHVLTCHTEWHRPSAPHRTSELQVGLAAEGAAKQPHKRVRFKPAPGGKLDGVCAAAASLPLSWHTNHAPASALSPLALSG